MCVVVCYEGCSTNSRTYVVFYTIINTYKSSAVAEMGDRFATVDMSQKWGLLFHFWCGNWVSKVSVDLYSALS